MANEIKWDAPLVRSELEKIGNWTSQYDFVKELPQEFSEEMQVMRKLNTCQTQLQEIFKTYFEVLVKDMNRVDQVLAQMLELDENTAGNLN